MINVFTLVSTEKPPDPAQQPTACFLKRRSNGRQEPFCSASVTSGLALAHALHKTEMSGSSDPIGEQSASVSFPQAILDGSSKAEQ